MSTSGDPARPARADARRNRQLVLEAAEVVLARTGVSARMEEIAQQAGVGVGTVYRHFRTKESLIEAIMRARLHTLIDEAESLADAPDAGAAVVGFFTRMVTQSRTKRAFSDALALAGIDIEPETRAAALKLQSALDVPLRRAQEAGDIRPDVTGPELMALIAGVSAAAERGGWDERLQDKALEIVLDGLRPAGRREG
ncbi:TetR/AcrR family transcriptional regulator [Microbispora cellulosiformans]|uniref:TetR/AcrR family transcriptional regulator n=1 Tax=Microbispora cellulosiformans TaxID=2614688 RepID=A0A5J5K1E6_9ACTN|nr:TetR/AcrR family transcriptional regulator [Microbispora cellulosiformans]KAA9378078.1 TetR/AcrR family transcriptional regulator [Microbispora cellulosiformans]